MDKQWDEARALLNRYFEILDVRWYDTETALPFMEQSARMGYGPAIVRMAYMLGFVVRFATRFYYVKQVYRLWPVTTSPYGLSALADDAREVLQHYRRSPICYRFGHFVAAHESPNSLTPFPHLVRVVRYYKVASIAARASIGEWLLIGRREFHVCRDVVRLIGSLVWAGRAEDFLEEV